MIKNNKSIYAILVTNKGLESRVATDQYIVINYLRIKKKSVNPTSRQMNVLFFSFRKKKYSRLTLRTLHTLPVKARKKMVPK